MEQTPILAGARRLATSSTALLGILAIIGVIVMNASGRIDGERALDFIKWIVIAHFTKVAVEDGAEKFGGKRLAATPGDSVAQPEAERDEKKGEEEEEEEGPGKVTFTRI